MKKILIASDSFKGTLTSIEIGEAFKKVYKNTEIVSISDGGEGFVESLLFNNTYFEKKIMKTTDDMNNEISIPVAIEGENAYIDVASIIALHNYPKFTSEQKTTYGIGKILKSFEDNEQIKQIFIGLGGSSTSDMGFYASLALGFKYLDKNGGEIKKLEGALEVVEIIKPKLKKKYIGLSDVENPLLGSEGALEVFGRQKGLDDKKIAEYTKYLEHIANLLSVDKINSEGAGAAGGLGYFVLANLNGEIKSGIKEMIRISNFADRSAQADIVITGEGAFDNQSFYGKAPYEIAKVSGNKKTILIAGIIKADESKIKEVFVDSFQLMKNGQSVEEAIKYSKENLDDVIANIVNKYLD